MRKTLPLLILIIVIVSLTLSACTYSNDGVVFGTFYSITAEGKGSGNSLIKDIENLLFDIENHVSTSIKTSDIYLLNNAKANVPIDVSDYVIELFELSVELNAISSSFNPAIFPIVELWGFDAAGFTGINQTLPTDEEINRLLPFCTLDNFILDKENKTITKLHDKAKLDFGAVAKGYSADLASSLAKDTNITINLGGDIYTKSKKSVAVKSPFNNDYCAKLYIENESVATCGSYERYYVIDARTYHHVIDKNGYPSGIFEDNPIVSVTVICQNAALADALATMLMIDGESLKDMLDDIKFSALIIRKNGDFTMIGEENRFEII